MSRKRNTTWRRTTDAYDVLRGRPPKPDYGLLIVLPLMASAAGALIGLGVDIALTRRAARRGGSDAGMSTSPDLMRSSGRHDA